MSASSVPTVRLDYDDAYTTRFTARVLGAGSHRNRPALQLESTYFYPESGGQEADRGTIGGVPVLDVQADDDGRVWHVIGAGGAAASGADTLAGAGAGAAGTSPGVAGPAAGAVAAPERPALPDALPTGDAPAEVDWARRFDHMQQHTGQHVLSAAFERVLDAATLSCHLGDERSSVELALADADWRTVERIEEAANRVVWEDRPIERHWVDDEGVKRFALRKPPAVSGRIRIVEIPDWDVSACGGTHTRRTGEVGTIKIVRWEKVRGNLRFEFLCGGRALRDHAWRTEALLEAAKRRTLKDRELIAHLERAAAERDDLAKRLRELTARAIATEARERVGSPPRGVSELFPERARDELRTFALKCLEAGAPWIAVAAAAPEPAVIVARAKGAGADLKALVPDLLARSRGKGGGAPDFVQVTAADAGAAEETWRWAAAKVVETSGRA